MKIYTAHLKNKIDDIITVKEGFSFAAFIFGCFWFFYKRIWLAGFVILLIQSILVFLEDQHYIGQTSLEIINFGLMLLIGFNANDLYRHNLEKRGYRFICPIVASNEDNAKYRLIENRHVLTH